MGEGYRGFQFVSGVLLGLQLESEDHTIYRGPDLSFSSRHSGVAHLKALPSPTPAINQIEIHPWCQQKEIVKYCFENNIVVQAYCPLVRADPNRFGDPVIQKLCQKHGKEPAQILVRWSLQMG